MPVKDTARDAAFAAMRTARAEIVRACREIHDDPEAAGNEHRAAERLGALLARHNFEIETGVAGLPTAFRATRRNHDADAMRKGLRHGHVAILARADAEGALGHVDGAPTGLAATLTASIGLGAALSDEFGTATLICYPGDASLLTMARAGVFDEFDIVLGARPASAGDGYCYTIDQTGATLARRSTTIAFDRDDAAEAAETFVALLGALEEYERITATSTDENVVDLTLTGAISNDVRDLGGMVERLVLETPGASISFGDAFHDTIVNRVLARRVKTYADTLGYKMDKIRKTEPAAATGWGSVSYAVPSFLLNFPITTETTEPVVRGEQSFAVAVAKSESYDRALEFAECLAMTGLDCLRDMQFRSIADDQLVKALALRGISRQHRRWLGVHPVIKEPGANGKNGKNSKNGKKGPKLSDFRMVRGPGMPDN